MAYTHKINMWSGPRNVSTAIMYAFAQRDNSRVVDEPFYAHYLLQSGAAHPVRGQVLDSQPHDPAVVMQQLLAGSAHSDTLFLKNMAHHMIKMGDQLDRLIDDFQHVFLIRDPAEMLISLDKTLLNPSMRDTAYQRQHELFEMVRDRNQPLHVIDAKQLLLDPKDVLSNLCANLGISFDDSMLSWETGPIPEDGVWAKHWYDNVHQSTGFKPYEPKDETMPDRLKPLYDRCKPLYDDLLAHAIT
jgi:hypothetical protein